MRVFFLVRFSGSKRYKGLVPVGWCEKVKPLYRRTNFVCPCSRSCLLLCLIWHFPLSLPFCDPSSHPQVATPTLEQTSVREMCCQVSQLVMPYGRETAVVAAECVIHLKRGAAHTALMGDVGGSSCRGHRGRLPYRDESHTR